MSSRLSVILASVSLLTLAHCMRVTDGIEVDVAYQPAATPAQIRTDLGYRVHLERALLVLGEVELIRCDNLVVDLWDLFGPRRARAHVLDTPTSLGTPVVLDLMESAGTPELAGTMKPPPGRYCGIRVVGMPADADALGLEGENADMLDRSVLVTGRVVHQATGAESLLSAEVSNAVDCELVLDRPLVFDSPVLETVSIEIDQTKWFDGIDFALISSEAVQRKLTENIRSSLQAVLPHAEDGL